MIIKKEYLGKNITITDAYGNKFTGKVVELQAPEEATSGEVEIGINFAGGIRMFAESELESIEEATE